MGGTLSLSLQRNKSRRGYIRYRDRDTYECTQWHGSQVLVHPILEAEKCHHRLSEPMAKESWCCSSKAWGLDHWWCGFYPQSGGLSTRSLGSGKYRSLSSSTQAERGKILHSSMFLFYSGSQRLGWSLLTLRRAINLTQSPNSNAIFF